MFRTRNILKRFVCDVLYYSGLLGLYINLFLKRKGNYPGVVLIYHRFSETMEDEIESEPTVLHPIGLFKKEMDFIKKHFNVVDMDRFVEILTQNTGFEKPTVAISIDDGTLDLYEKMYPILKKNRIPAIVYLATDFIGSHKKIWVDELGQILRDTRKGDLKTNEDLGCINLSFSGIREKRKAYHTLLERMKELDISKRINCIKDIRVKLDGIEENFPFMLNWDQVREMSMNGISFGAHTCTHPILSRMPLHDAEEEIGKSKDVIEKSLGITVRHFAYPNGRSEDFSEELRVYCKKIKFKSICSSELGSNSSSMDAWNMKRMGSFAPLSLFTVNLVRQFFKRNSLIAHN